MTLSESSTINHTLIRDDRLKPRDPCDGIRVRVENRHAAVRARKVAGAIEKWRKVVRDGQD